MGLSRQEYWSGLPFLSPGYLPKPGIKFASPTWQADHLPLSHLASRKSLLLLFSCSVVSDSLQLCGLPHARLPCPSPSPRACSNSCLLSLWCHQAISSSVVPSSSCLQSFRASGSFPMSHFFALDGQSIGASASVSVLPMNIQDWFPLGMVVWLPCSPRDSQEFSPVPQFETSLSKHPDFFMVQLSHLYITARKTIALTIQAFFDKVIPLLFNILSKIVIAFLSRRKHILNSWLQSLSAVILKPKKIKSIVASTFYPSICHEMMVQDARIIAFFFFLNVKI